MDSRSLGYAIWPEQAEPILSYSRDSRSLGYAIWPELEGWTRKTSLILDHWDMRSDRNMTPKEPNHFSILDHWDMRSGRNLKGTN